MVTPTGLVISSCKVYHGQAYRVYDLIDRYLPTPPGSPPHGAAAATPCAPPPLSPPPPSSPPPAASPPPPAPGRSRYALAVRKPLFHHRRLRFSPRAVCGRFRRRAGRFDARPPASDVEGLLSVSTFECSEQRTCSMVATVSRSEADFCCSSPSAPSARRASSSTPLTRRCRDPTSVTASLTASRICMITRCAAALSSRTMPAATPHANHAARTSTASLIIRAS
eukprot:1940695-Pyramimonas_sp.AAC.1